MIKYPQLEVTDMSETIRQKPRSIFPSEAQILSGSALKLIACITMLIDHTGSMILSRCDWAVKPALFQFLGQNITWYRLSRDIGRMAFPIFCFLLVEGFQYTHNRFHYARNLLIFALISEIPWNIWHHNTILYPDKQNVFFTLFLGVLAFCAIEYFSEKEYMQLLCLLGLLVVSYYLKADYGWKGYVFLLIMYYFRYFKASQAIIGTCWLIYEWKACVAFIPINLYNGQRGFIKGKAAKYAFYAFYPVHVVILILLRRRLFGI